MQEAVNNDHNDNITDSIKQNDFKFTPKILNTKKYSRKNLIDSHIKKRNFSPISARHFERTFGLPIVKSSKIKKQEPKSIINNNNDDIFNADIFETDKAIKLQKETNEVEISSIKRENSVEIIYPEVKKKGKDDESKNVKDIFPEKSDTEVQVLEENVEVKEDEKDLKKEDMEVKEEENKTNDDLNNVFSFEKNDDFAKSKAKSRQRLYDDGDDDDDYLDIKPKRRKKNTKSLNLEENIDEQIMKELNSTNTHGSSDFPLHIDSDSDCEQEQDESENDKSNELDLTVTPLEGRSSIVTRSRQRKSKAHKDKIICVFPQGAPDAITLLQSDIDRLVPDIHLNDSIIDFYMRYIRDFILTEEQRKKFFFFNCFFFRSLTSKNAGYEKVKNWTRNVNIFDYDFIFIPINQSFHWKLAVICFAREVNRNVSDPNVITSCILLFDSLSNHGGFVFNELRKYLTLEAKRKGENFGEFVKENMPGFSPNVPKQSNTSDCGLFVLHYAEKFCTDPPTSITSIQNIKNKFNRHWFPPESVSSKRQIVLDIIHQLASLGDSNNRKNDNAN